MRSRNYRVIGAVLASAAVLLSGCGNGASSETATENSDYIVVNAEAVADKNAGADSLEALCEASDIILTATVSSSDHYVDSTKERIMSELTLENATVYKGEYNGGSITSPGGVMPVSDYLRMIGSERAANFAYLTEEERENGKIAYKWCNVPYVDEGQEVLIFCYYAEEDGEKFLVSTYFGTGTFPVKDGVIDLSDDQVDEMLVENLQTRFGESVTLEAMLDATKEIIAQ